MYEKVRHGDISMPCLRPGLSIWGSFGAIASPNWLTKSCLVGRWSNRRTCALRMTGKLKRRMLSHLFLRENALVKKKNVLFECSVKLI